MKRLLVLISMLAAACGPNSGDGGGGRDAGAGAPDAYTGPTGSVSGVVWAPGNAPGMVPAGHEIPISGALVYLSLGRPSPLPDEVYCNQCIDTPGESVLTDADGNFSLAGRVPNIYWLVIQKGQFRLVQRITIEPEIDLRLPTAETTLPSADDPVNGKEIPRIAVASGNYDHLEDILGKMGLGEVDGQGLFVRNSAAGVFDVYANGGSIDSVAIGPLSQLIGDINTMLNYHIIFIPCSEGGFEHMLGEEAVLRRFQEYVRRGGKLYVTDWSGEWADNVFPAQVELINQGFDGDGVDTPASAYNAESDTWNTNQFGHADGADEYNSSDGEAAVEELHAWLDGQMGPTPGGAVQTYNASGFTVADSWDRINSLTRVQIGVDGEGLPVHDDPIAWVIGSYSNPDSGGKKPLTVTYEPVGCGRVLYSTYHTTNGTHVGLVPQERVLLYLIMEIGVCKSGPIID